eukprot:761550-Hanusia_phi.AAC.6
MIRLASVIRIRLTSVLLHIFVDLLSQDLTSIACLSASSITVVAAALDDFAIAARLWATYRTIFLFLSSLISAARPRQLAGLPGLSRQWSAVAEQVAEVRGPESPHKTCEVERDALLLL